MLANHLKKLSRSLKRHTEARKAPSQLLDEVRKLTDLLLEQEVTAFRSAHPNPLARFGRKCFSQGDEDGITIEILRRIGLLERGAGEAATYAEFGVGYGTENNTLILASLGWRGFWAGGQKLAFDYRPNARFCFFNEWITRGNIVDIMQRGLSHLGSSGLDVVSIDVDGNDYYFAEALLLAKARPRLFIVEYNAKFPPPVPFKMPYNADHVWDGGDFMGASLQSLNELFVDSGYRLICCNAHSGVNAFFVRGDCSREFADVPADLARIYVEPRYRFFREYGHGISSALLGHLLGGSRNASS